MGQTDFNTMVSEIPSGIANIEYQIEKIEEQITDLNTQFDDIKTLVLAPMVSASNDYISTKKTELEALTGGSLTFCTSAAAGYGVTNSIIGNLTEWAIVSGGNCNDWKLFEEGFSPSASLWTYSDVTSASPSAASPSASDYHQWKRQYDYTNVIDQLHRQFTYDDGDDLPVENYPDRYTGAGLVPITTYGIVASSAGLKKAINILTRNKNKLQQVYSVYSEYTTQP